ncbi:MAG: hypothetical protein JXB62_00415 [Pirellulales bacterium]|nr:hypothetical protein [Pirellulales bacterium]
MALLKHGASRNHPAIVATVADIQDALKRGSPSEIFLGPDDIYSLGLATIFLVHFDPIRNAGEIQFLLDVLKHRQKPHGGWGYTNRESGDTSMTQYAVLGLWEATQAGFQVPVETTEKVAVWLLKTQAPDGAFGYQGNVSETFTPIPQSQIRVSLTVAGLGSVYVCSDLLGLVVRPEEPADDLPPALRKVRQDRPAKPDARVKTQLDPNLFKAVQGRGMMWMRQNYEIDPKNVNYTYYYLYALERCMSFRELCEEGPPSEKQTDGPPWYNDGVGLLLRTQNEDGSWASKSSAGPVADTSFAVLFLLRSTRTRIQDMRGLGDGMLIGGRGLPKDTDQAQVGRNGTVVTRPLLGPAEQLMTMLESAEVPDYRQAANLVAELPPEHAEAVMKKYADRLRKLAGDPSAAARMAAVQTLARSRNMDSVPTLIYALTDPDLAVAIVARDALRRISRRPAGFGLPNSPSDAQRREAVDQWKKWYLAIRPDAEFED